MTLKSSGLWCDLCNKPLLSDPVYWDCTINGKANCHSCNPCYMKMRAEEEEAEDESSDRPL